MRTVLLTTLLLVSLDARENPFFPAKGSETPNYSTNRVEKPQPFDRLVIRLPDTARILKSVTLTCENLDGSLTTKEIPVDKAIDWHDRIVVIPQKKLFDGVKNEKKVTRPAYRRIAKMPFISLYAHDRQLKIVTRDRLLRDFKLVKPDRIVLDFKRDADFLTYRFKGSIPFKKITIGNHSGYYRVVIELDGRYIYHIRPYTQGYMLTLE